MSKEEAVHIHTEHYGPFEYCSYWVINGMQFKLEAKGITQPCRVWQWHLGWVLHLVYHEQYEEPVQLMKRYIEYLQKVSKAKQD